VVKGGTHKVGEVVKDGIWNGMKIW